MANSSGFERALRFFGLGFARLIYRVTTIGREQLPQGGFLLLPNHISWVDAIVLSHLQSRKFIPFLAELNPQDLSILGELMQSGKITPVIDRRYSLKELPAAMRYVEVGHARGKVVIVVE